MEYPERTKKAIEKCKEQGDDCTNCPYFQVQGDEGRTACELFARACGKETIRDLLGDK